MVVIGEQPIATLFWFFLVFEHQLRINRGMAVASLLRTLVLKGVWGIRPQLGVPSLHPVLSQLTMAIAVEPTSKLIKLISFRSNQVSDPL
jgi:hypothetical protein